MKPERRPPPAASLDLHAAIRRHRLAVLAISAAIFLFSLYAARSLVWSEDIMELLPDRDPSVAGYRRLLEAFHPHDTVYFAIAAPSASIEEIAATADRLAERLEATGHFTQIIHRFDSDTLLDAFDFLRERRPLLFTEDDARAIERKITPDAMAATLEKWKRTLIESPAPMLTAAFRRDPLGFDETMLGRLDDLRGGKDGPIRVEIDHLFSRDGASALLMARPRRPSTDSRFAQTLVADIDRLIADAKRDSPPGLDIAYLAGHRYALENASRVKADIALTVTLATVAISLLVFLTFARPIYVILTLLPAAFGAAVAAGAARWFLPEISAISIGCGSMLLAVAVDYGIHILYHADSPAPGESLADILRRLTRPLLLSAATTTIAFFTLGVSTFPGYRQLGLFAAIGVGSAALFALFVLPLLLPARPLAARRAPLLPLASLYAPFVQWAYRRRFALRLVLAIVSIAALAGLPRVRFDGDIEKLNAATPAIRADAQTARHAFGGALSASAIAVEADGLEAALKENARLSATLSLLRQQGAVTDYSSLSALCPSAHAQKENLERWNAFWTDRRIEQLQTNFREACRAHRLRAESFDDFLAESRPLKPGEITPFSPDAFPKGALADLARSQIAATPDGQTLILTRVHFSEAGKEIARKTLEDQFPALLVADGADFVQRAVAAIAAELRRMAPIAMAGVLMILIVFVRRPGRIMFLIAPLLLGMLWTFGLMGWTGIQINLMNGVTIIFIFGLVVDYGIFHLSAWADSTGPSDPHLARSSGAVAISALTTLIGLGSLALARHPALHAIGQTALIGVAAGWLATLLVAPLAPKKSARSSFE